MKRSILALALLPMCAQAVDIEIGTGATHYKTAHDGLWYQAAYPHTFDLNDTPMSIGVSGERNGIRYRAEYLYLGWMFNSAQWVPDSDYYAGTTATPTRRGVGRGSASGIMLSASRPVPVFGIPFYAEAGTWVYVAKYKISVTRTDVGDSFDYEVPKTWHVGPAVGFGIRYSGIDIGIKYLGMQYTGGEYPVYNHAYVLETKVYF